MALGTSLFLIALGAILAFAINVADPTVGSLTINWDVMGFILMAIGLIGLIWSMLFWSSWAERRRGSVVHERTIDDRDRDPIA